MKWRSGRRSRNVEDRRGQRPKGLAIGGGTLILGLVITVLLGGDPQTFLSLVTSSQGSVSSGSGRSRMGETPTVDKNDDSSQFVSVVLADTEDTWNKLFSQTNRSYVPPKLVLFSDSVRSACGMASAASGPFYCPGDKKVYLDLSFFAELRRMGGSGDFAAAYVIAHEVGHHVQTLLGISAQVRQAQSRVSKTEGNAIQVKMELQADCLSGLWAHHAQRDRQVLEQGDIEEALSAAGAVGDDQIMKKAGRAVRPESFTHGTSQQRINAFQSGFRSGQLNTCI